METVGRVVFVYVVLWAGFRVVGKRELTRMTPFELVTLLLIPQLFSRALTRQDYSMTNAVIGSATLFTLLLLTSILSHRFARFRRVLQARPTVLVVHGQIQTECLDRERIAETDIHAAMHHAGIRDLADVEWAILEGDGRISVIPCRSGVNPGTASLI
jgi:uncharacterized membrane protein YcaP (DUF421 family)